MSLQPGSFAAKLKAFRSQAGLTQQELAEKTKLAISTIRSLEQGAYADPTWGTLQAITVALGVSCEAFRDDSPQPEPQPRGRKK